MKEGTTLHPTAGSQHYDRGGRAWGTTDHTSREENTLPADLLTYQHKSSGADHVNHSLKQHNLHLLMKESKFPREQVTNRSTWKNLTVLQHPNAWNRNEFEKMEGKLAEVNLIWTDVAENSIFVFQRNMKAPGIWRAESCYVLQNKWIIPTEWCQVMTHSK